MSYATISVGAGLSFQISQESFDRARAKANQTGKIHFVGLLEDGAELESTNRDEILSAGAQSIAWIVPEFIPQPPAPAGELSVSRIINAALALPLFSRKDGAR